MTNSYKPAGIVSLSVDTSNWNNEMIRDLLKDVAAINEQLEKRVKTPQETIPDEYRQKWEDLKVWHRQFIEDRNRFLALVPVSKKVRDLLEGVMIINARNHWLYGFLQWISPHATGLRYHYGKIPPCLMTILQDMQKGRQSTIEGIGPKTAKEIVELSIKAGVLEVEK